MLLLFSKKCRSHFFLSAKSAQCGTMDWSCDSLSAICWPGLGPGVKVSIPLLTTVKPACSGASGFISSKRKVRVKRAGAREDSRSELIVKYNH